MLLSPPAVCSARRYEAVIVDCGKAIDLDAENPKVCADDTAARLQFSLERIALLH